MSYRYLNEARSVLPDRAELGRVMEMSVGLRTQTRSNTAIAGSRRPASRATMPSSTSLHTLQRILADHPHEDRTCLLAARVLHGFGDHAEAGTGSPSRSAPRCRWDCARRPGRTPRSPDRAGPRPHEDRTCLLAARVLHGFGDHAEAARCLDRIPLDCRQSTCRPSCRNRIAFS
jgi:hypothetical protein